MADFGRGITSGRQRDIERRVKGGRDRQIQIDKEERESETEREREARSIEEIFEYVGSRDERKEPDHILVFK